MNIKKLSLTLFFETRTSAEQTGKLAKTLQPLSRR